MGHFFYLFWIPPAFTWGRMCELLLRSYIVLLQVSVTVWELLLPEQLEGAQPPKCTSKSTQTNVLSISNPKSCLPKKSLTNPCFACKMPTISLGTLLSELCMLLFPWHDRFLMFQSGADPVASRIVSCTVQCWRETVYEELSINKDTCMYHMHAPHANTQNGCIWKFIQCY